MYALNVGYHNGDVVVFVVGYRIVVVVGILVLFPVEFLL